MSDAPQLDNVDLNLRLADAESYQGRLKALQDRLTRLQAACFHQRRRAVLVFEGWDASGKGGAIRRLAEKLDPRSYRVHATGKPSDTELNEHYLQRFWRNIPQQGHIAIFDRSWYGRVLVERIEKLASSTAWRRAYREINEFERQLHDDGIVLVKVLLHISQDEQLRRFVERLDNPDKNWKLNEEDLRNRTQANDYRRAYQDMLDNTHTGHAPWTVIPGEHKWYARVAVLEVVVATLERFIEPAVPRLSDAQIRAAKKALGLAPGK